MDFLCRSSVDQSISRVNLLLFANSHIYHRIHHQQGYMPVILFPFSPEQPMADQLGDTDKW